MIEVGSYERTLRASLERLIENALDWEHLPFVHAESFDAIDLVSADEGGWTARSAISGSADVEVSLRLDQDQLGWITTTSFEGRKLAQIESRAKAVSATSCHVSVRFLVPDASEEGRAAIGYYYASLYAKLYDEDEALMIARASALGRSASQRQEKREVKLANGRTVSIPLYCPHQGLPLTGEPNDDGIVTCPWHGYQFDVLTGDCVSGHECRWLA